MPKIQKESAPSKKSGFVKIQDGIHVYVGGSGSTNFGLILTKEKPVVIDNDIRCRKEFTTGMKKITKKQPGILFNTHHNFDHTSDNGYYHKMGVMSFGNSFAVEEMYREENEGIWVKQMVGRGPKVEHLLKTLKVDPPKVIFENLLTIEYGGRIFQLIYIDHCHTKGDSVIWMPKEKVLFAGDLLTYKTHPVNRLGNFHNWISAFKILEEFPAKHIIPGHGPMPPTGKKIIQDNKKMFLKLKNDTGRALKKYTTPAKAAENVHLREYEKWFRYPLVKANAHKMAQEIKRKNRK